MHWTRWAAISLKAAVWRRPWGGHADHQPVICPCYNSIPSWILQAEHGQQVEGENLSLLLSGGGTCQECSVQFWFPSTLETWTKWRQPNKRPWRLWGLKILIQEDRLRELEPFIPKKNVQRDLIHTYKALVRVASTNLNTGNSIVHKKKLFSFGVQRKVMESPSLLIHRTQMDVAQSNLL